MSTASQGSSREHLCRDALTEHGFEPIMRAAASKGAADLLLAHETHGPILVQVGTMSKRGGIGPADRARFLRAAALCRAIPVVALKAPRKPFEYYRLVDGPPSSWPAWDPATGADVVTLLAAA